MQKRFSAGRILYHGRLKTGLRIQNAIHAEVNRVERSVWKDADDCPFKKAVYLDHRKQKSSVVIVSNKLWKMP